MSSNIHHLQFSLADDGAVVTRRPDREQLYV